MILTPRLREIAAELAAERAATETARAEAAVTRQKDGALAAAVDLIASWGIPRDDIDPDAITVHLDVDDDGSHPGTGAVLVDGLRFRATWPDGILNSPRLDLTKLCHTCGVDVVIGAHTAFLDRLMAAYDAPLGEHDAGEDERCDGTKVERVIPPAPPVPYRVVTAETAAELEARMIEGHAEGYRVRAVDLRTWPMTALLAHLTAG